MLGALDQPHPGPLLLEFHPLPTAVVPPLPQLGRKPHDVCFVKAWTNGYVSAFAVLNTCVYTRISPADMKPTCASWSTCCEMPLGCCCTIVPVRMVGDVRPVPGDGAVARDTIPLVGGAEEIPQHVSPAGLIAPPVHWSTSHGNHNIPYVFK